MTSKTYSNQGNCARAAKKALGADAKRGVDFDLTKVDGGFTWHAKAAPSKRLKGHKAPLAGQPQMEKLLKAIRAGRGKTVSELQAHLGGVASHTVRGQISRLRADKVKIVSTQEGRNVRYSLDAA